MNAAIRAVVRTGNYYGLDVFGIMRGYSGIIENDIVPMHSRSVANIIQRGGTILKTARCKEILSTRRTSESLSKSQKAGHRWFGDHWWRRFFQRRGYFQPRIRHPCIGLPGTIDKDIAGTDFTIGFDTAVNTAVEAIDKIRDTADAHDRLIHY